jgi:hypothetical protein
MRGSVGMALTCVMGTLVAVGRTPVSASQVAGGSLAFAGTVSIPTFPCPAPLPGQPLCAGTFTASTAGAISGMDGSNPWEVALNAMTNGSFAYVDNLDPIPACSAGTAQGTASLDTSMSGQAFGTYEASDGLHAVRNAAVVYSFSWLRVGGVAQLAVTGASITLQVDAIGAIHVLSSGSAQAVASFVPAPNSSLPTGCTGGPPTSLRGSIFGDVTGGSVQL